MNNASLESILNQALKDEIKARDTYYKIIEAGQRHIERLLPLYEKYAIPLPDEQDPDRVVIPETLESACQLGIEGELENIAISMDRVEDVNLLSLAALI